MLFRNSELKLNFLGFKANGLLHFFLYNSLKAREKSQGRIGLASKMKVGYIILVSGVGNHSHLENRIDRMFFLL